MVRELGSTENSLEGEFAPSLRWGAVQILIGVARGVVVAAGVVAGTATGWAVVAGAAAGQWSLRWDQHQGPCAVRHVGGEEWCGVHVG